MAKREFKTKAELKTFARDLASALARPAIVLLEGNLGAGKTQVVRWMTEALGVTDAASPTFAIHHEYESPFGLIGHVDLYRVKSDEDLENSGFWDLLREPDALLFVEWADRLPADVWPTRWMKITMKLTKVDDGEARILDWEITRP